MNSNIRKINNHLTITSCNEIAEIMLPHLLKHDITVFNYYKYYPDGYGVRYSTHRAWSERYLEKGYNLTTTVPDVYFKKPINYFFWLIKDCPPMLIDAATNFDIGNGITIAHRNENSIESFAFASRTNNTSIINFYLNNLDSLHNYCFLFKEKAASLLELGEKNKMQLIMNNINSERHSSLLELNLSKRQIDCVYLLLNGKRYKEIAIKLNLSVRTVEAYIDAIKIKLSCKNINELLIKLSKMM